MSQNSEQAPKKGIKTFYISTIFSISLVLLMVGLLGLIVLHGKNLSNFVKENIVLNIILDEEARDADIFKLQKEIEKNPAIKDTEYISKELAARNLSKDLGEDFIKFLGYNPLTASIDVYLKAEYATNDEIQKFTRKLKSKMMIVDIEAE